MEADISTWRKTGHFYFALTRRETALWAKSFHEKAGECQGFSSIFLFFPFLYFFFFQIVPIESSRLCRHPSIRTLC
jgi:hypothetical protein